MTTLERVRLAFRKLKAHVYFDKTTLPLRDKVVEFESQEDFEAKLIEIAAAYDEMELCNDSPLMEIILSSISVMPFPKKMKSAAHNNNTVISIGNPKEKPIVSELQYFIDMDVRGHILGILWIMVFGKRLDKLCFENARGNRLRSKLIWNEDDCIMDSPALFEPYFAQYSLWRDGGLTCAEEMLAKGHDALILTLDLKKFYYRTGITKFVFNEILNNDDSVNEQILHSAIFAILESYSEILEKQSIDHSGVALPIGFLPSAVLSNWCLSKFDKGILDYWNPNYYGRYVDDIIIVEKIEKGSEIYRRSRENSLTKSLAIEYYLGNGRRINAVRFASKFAVPDKPSVANDERVESTESTDLYRVNLEFCLSSNSLYEFQSTKTRIIALFSDNNSTALYSPGELRQRLI